MGWVGLVGGLGWCWLMGGLVDWSVDGWVSGALLLPPLSVRGIGEVPPRAPIQEQKSQRHKSGVCALERPVRELHREARACATTPTSKLTLTACIRPAMFLCFLPVATAWFTDVGVKSMELVLAKASPLVQCILAEPNPCCPSGAPTARWWHASGARGMALRRLSGAKRRPIGDRAAA